MRSCSEDHLEEQVWPCETYCMRQVPRTLYKFNALWLFGSVQVIIRVYAFSALRTLPTSHRAFISAAKKAHLVEMLNFSKVKLVKDLLWSVPIVQLNILFSWYCLLCWKVIITSHFGMIPPLTPVTPPPSHISQSSMMYKIHIAYVFGVPT